MGFNKFRLRRGIWNHGDCVNFGASDGTLAIVLITPVTLFRSAKRQTSSVSHSIFLKEKKLNRALAKQRSNDCYQDCGQDNLSNECQPETISPAKSR